MSAINLETLLHLSGVPAAPHYSVTDATKILHPTPRTSVNRLIRKHRIPAVAVNRKQKLIPHDGLAEFIRAAAGSVHPANDERV